MKPEKKWLSSGAIFSSCKRYRYWLQRTWRRGEKMCLFLMLNPSTADEQKNDPTVERCERFARRWGFDGMVVCNLFALRSTDPDLIYTAVDAVGPENDRYIRGFAEDNTIVCAWGVHGEFHDRDKTVIKLLAGRPLFCLGVTKHGHPKHPLYLKSETKLERFRFRER